MNPRTFVISVLAILLYLAAGHFDASAQKVSFAYDVDFDMQFDNREFYKSAYTPSMTIFGARLTPSVGIAVAQNNGTHHKVLLGIDVQKDFGAANPVNELFRELTLYYSLEKQIGKTGLSIDAGIFPRRLMSDDYSRAFFSDSLKFYDNNLEGLLVRIRRPKADFEIGCDWMGQYGKFRRERFMVFSAGKGKVAPFLSIGYGAWLYHFSVSEVSHGVVDNVLLNPYLLFDFAEMTGLQKFSVRLGYLQAMQNDRQFVGRYVFPGGAELDVDLRKWNVGICNELYYGKDLFPYYNRYDEGGFKYGNLLYPGSPFYRVWDDGTAGAGLIDRLEVYYAPKIGGPYLDMRISAVFHFSQRGGYNGCRQMVSLNFNLQELLSLRARREGSSPDSE